MTDDDDTRQDRKRRYERVLGCIRHQTSPAQPAGLRHGSLLSILCGSKPRDVEDVTKALRAARANDDIVRYEDRAGRWRYALATPSALRDVVAEENGREDTRTAVCAWAAEQIHTIES